jgi:hypothetical protein
MRKAVLACSVLLCSLFSFAQSYSRFVFKEQPGKKQIYVLYNDNLLTSYCWYDSIKKPVLFPINTLDGITVTRGFPLAPRPGEPTDHPHHIGMWMNYESVNGLDFWNHSTAIPYDKRNLYGTILHQKIISKKVFGNQASLVTTATWVHPDGLVLLDEKTEHRFAVKNNLFFIDRITTLTASDTTVLFKDVKDGFFAMRVAHELEQPSQDERTFTDAQGNKTTVPKATNEGVTGRYFSSAGLQGDSVWSSHGAWVMLKGIKDGKKITIAMIDPPKHVGYPTYWHARGYGLFELNPLGRAVFSNGKETLNFSLQPHTSVTFHYRVLIASDQDITTEQMNGFAAAFAREK